MISADRDVSIEDTYMLDEFLWCFFWTLNYPIGSLSADSKNVSTAPEAVL